MDLPQLQNFTTYQDIKVIDQQQQQAQVQPLTFNGQPAIFIPCSAYSSNSDLLSQIQMLMNSNNNSSNNNANNNNNNNNNQIFEIQQPQYAQVQLCGNNNNNNNQFAHLLGNGNNNNNNNGSKCSFLIRINFIKSNFYPKIKCKMVI